jgi:hypothetical protein
MLIALITIAALLLAVFGNTLSSRGHAPTEPVPARPLRGAP